MAPGRSPASVMSPSPSPSRTSGKYEMGLPWFLPHDQGAVELMNDVHGSCLDCRHNPPTKWTPTQVAVQVAAAGLQGSTVAGGVDVGAIFAKHHVGGRLLLKPPGGGGVWGLVRGAHGVPGPDQTPRSCSTAILGLLRASPWR